MLMYMNILYFWAHRGGNWLNVHNFFLKIYIFLLFLHFIVGVSVCSSLHVGTADSVVIHICVCTCVWGCVWFPKQYRSGSETRSCSETDGTCLSISEDVGKEKRVWGVPLCLQANQGGATHVLLTPIRSCIVSRPNTHVHAGFFRWWMCIHVYYLLRTDATRFLGSFVASFQ